MAEQNEEEQWSWAQPSTDSQDVAQDYDAFAAEYDQTVASWRYEAPDVAAPLLLAQLGGTGRVLDAGCGTGWSGKALASVGFADVAGVDVSAESVKQAAATNAYTSLNVVDLTKRLPCPDDCFDATFSTGVFTYIDPAEPVLREFARVVRPGGIILITSRTDLWQQRDYPAMIDRIMSDGIWHPTYQSEPKPYLPGHPDYAEHINVIYACFKVL